MEDQHWAYATAGELIKNNPGKTIVCASGISPSGIVHAGNLREVMTAYFVNTALKHLGADTKLLFSWDNFDALKLVNRFHSII